MPLTANQLILLHELQAASPGIARKDHLMKCLWARKPWPEKPDRILACQISRMRPVIWPLGLAIITEYGQGYRLVGRAQPQMSIPVFTGGETASCKVAVT